jgi:hypothetical protein
MSVPARRKLSQSRGDETSEETTLRRKHQGETRLRRIRLTRFYARLSFLLLQGGQARSPRKLLRRELAVCRILQQASARTFAGQMLNLVRTLRRLCLKRLIADFRARFAATFFSLPVSNIRYQT